MDRWAGKVAVVTGANTAIGLAILRELVKAKMIVVGLARQVETIEVLKAEVDRFNVPKRLHAMICDISKEEEVSETFKAICKKFGGVDVLINGATITCHTQLIDPGNTQKLRDIFDTNVMGLILCSREAFHSMKRRAFDGHIIHLSSLAGHTVPRIPRVNVYPATKFAVRAITETMRHELLAAGTKIKVSCVSPSAILTEMIPETSRGKKTHMLDPVDIANAILYVLGTPPRVQVHDLIIKPMGDDF